MLPSTVAVREYTGEMVAIGEMVADPKPAKHDAKYRELFCNLFLQFTSESTDKDESLHGQFDASDRMDLERWAVGVIRKHIHRHPVLRFAPGGKGYVEACFSFYGTVRSFYAAQLHGSDDTSARKRPWPLI